MLVRHLRALAPLALSLLLACSTAVAAPSAAKPATQPTPTAMPGLLPVSDFARHPRLSDPRLSPDGKHLLVSVTSASGKEHTLVVYKLSNMSIVSQLHMQIHQLPLDPTWVDNDWIALEIGKKIGSLDKPVNTGQVIATNIHGGRGRYLYGDAGYGRRWATRGPDQGDGFIAGRPEIPNGHVYLRAEPWDRNGLSMLYDIDVADNSRQLIAKLPVFGMSFLVSPKGKATYAFGANANFDYVAYQQTGSAWKPLELQQVGDYFDPLAYTPDHKHIYVLTNPGGGPTELISETLNGSQRKLLASNPFASVGDIQWTAPPLRPFAVMPEGGVPHAIFINPNGHYAKLYTALQNAFPHEIVDFINFDQDGGKLLFFVSSDRDPGTYYLLNAHTGKVRKLFALAPWINPSQMATRKPFQFKAKDGMTLDGILTFPLHRKRQNLPMVLIPHGGPYGISDTWYFEWFAQLLANRGYLVLQVNFRGSGGRGVNFVHAGYRQWGTGIQRDLIDGVKWTIAHHYADPNRICVFGGSFGGYSALMAVIRAPHLFKCAIGYDGVYSLGMLFKKGNIQSTKFGRSYLATVLGHNQAKLAANSPDKLAARIDVPVFLAHGKDDHQAPYAGALAMRAALAAAHKPFEWMAVAGEGHGFYTEQDRAAFYTRMQAFLRKYIGPGALPTQPAP